MTLWQRRRASVARFWRSLRRTLKLTIQGYTVMAVRYLAPAALLLLAIQEQFQQALDAGDGTVVKAYVQVDCPAGHRHCRRRPGHSDGAEAADSVGRAGGLRRPPRASGRPIAKVFGECWITSPNNLVVMKTYPPRRRRKQWCKKRNYLSCPGAPCAMPA